LLIIPISGSFTIFTLQFFVMIIHNGYEKLDLVSPVVTMGVFDGVHLGHRSLIDTLVLRAREKKSESAVITFNSHPRLILQQNHRGLSFLSTIEEKASLLQERGIDHLIIVEFTHHLSNMDACQFVQEVLIEKVKTRHLIVGYDHHFGKKGKGNFETIKKCVQTFNFIVEKVEGLKSTEGAVSSSSIRRALLEGRINEANNWLGYSYLISGKIVEGKKIGHSFGFPTANIKPDYEFKLIPGDGVYAVLVQLDGTYFPGMLNIGKNPTISSWNNIRSIEAHIFNFDKDIYGKDIKVVFRERLRDEIKFENTDQLVQQMNRDKEQALRLLS
jgi:riboflavin kinase / FMN adenylyltransferase